MTSVSVVVPVFNVERYLERCLDSLVNQTLKDIEVILVYDTSIDNSLSILKEYANAHDFIKIIEQGTNLRQGGARNSGIEAASGKYIGFVDSDDRVSLDMFEKLYLKAKETDSDIVDCDGHYVLDDKNRCEPIISNSVEQTGDLDLEKKKKLILNGGRMWTKIYRRELFLDHDIRFPEGLRYEDNPVLPLLLVYSQRLEKVPEGLYFYYLNELSTTQTMNAHHHFDRLKTSTMLLDEFKRRGLYQQYEEELLFRFAELYYINTIHLCLSRFDRPDISVLKEIRKYMKEHYKNYRANQYYHRIERWKRSLAWLNDLSPLLLVRSYALYKKIRPNRP